MYYINIVLLILKELCLTFSGRQSIHNLYQMQQSRSVKGERVWCCLQGIVETGTISISIVSPWWFFIIIALGKKSIKYLKAASFMNRLDKIT